MDNTQPNEAMPHTLTFARIRERVNEVPFRPFRIVTTSGRTYQVPTLDHIGLLAKSRLLIVATDDGGAVDIPSMHVSSIEPHRRRKAA